MRRRIGLGLLVASALLVAPALATTAPDPGRDQQQAARVVADRHATVGHVATRVAAGRERRAPHHSVSVPGVLGDAAGVAPQLTWTQLAAHLTSIADDLPPSSSARAPPAVV